jgi:hypothetical protein
MKMAVFWVVAQCSLVEVYQRFRGPCCLHHQGDDRVRLHGATTQNRAISLFCVSSDSESMTLSLSLSHTHTHTHTHTHSVTYEISLVFEHSL